MCTFVLDSEKDTVELGNLQSNCAPRILLRSSHGLRTFVLDSEKDTVAQGHLQSNCAPRITTIKRFVQICLRIVTSVSVPTCWVDGSERASGRKAPRPPELAAPSQPAPGAWGTPCTQMCMYVHARVRDSNEQIVPLIAFYVLNGNGTDKLGTQEAWM